MGSKLGKIKILVTQMGQYGTTHDFGKTFFENGKVKVYAYPRNKRPNEMQKALYHKHKADWHFRRTFKKHYRKSRKFK